MKVILLSFGRWRYERVLQGFRWRKSVPIPSILGVAALILNLENRRKFTPFDDTIFTLGGVLTNFLAGTISFILYYQLQPASTYGQIILSAFGFSGFYLGIYNLLPIKIRGWATDGLSAIQILQKKGWELRRKNLYLASLSNHGNPPHTWPPEDLPPLEELQQKDTAIDIKMSAYSLRLEYALDTDNPEMAEKSAAWIAEHFNQLPDGIRQVLALQMAIWALRFLGDQALFNAWRPLCERGLYNLTVRTAKIDAEYACLTGDTALARQTIQKARAALPTLATQSHIDNVQKELNCLEEKINLIPAATPTVPLSTT